MSDAVEGSCLCGHIKYRLANRPPRAHLCFCSDCQKATGGDRNHIAPVPLDDFILTSGELSLYEATAASGRTIERAFCPHCGCSIYGAVRVLGGMGVNVPCFDHPEEFPPQAALFVSHAPPWAAIPEGIPQYAEMPSPQKRE